MRYWIAPLLMLAGCAGQMEMHKPGISDADWKKDDFECMREAYNTGGGSVNQYGRYTREANPGMYQSCMEARGYTRLS